jgi:hypothetical protein
VTMAESRLRADWDRTSHAMWLTAEIHRDRKKRPRPYKPADFHPHARRTPKGKLPKVKMKDLKLMMGGLKPWPGR